MSAGPAREHAGSFRDVDAGSQAQRAAAVAALDVQAQLPAVRRLKAWAVEQLDPRPGARALDVGCGTGEDVQGLALLVAPGGRALGVDPSRAMVEVARRRAATTGSAARFAVGAAERLPVGDAEVDLVRVERVLQHVPGPAAAVAEVHRVLRPGGRAVLVDTDWRTLAVWPGEPAVVAAAREAWAARVPQPAAGARLLDLVAEAGFTDPRLTAEVLLLRPAGAGDPPLGLVVAVAAAAGLDPGAVEAWRRELARAASRGTLVVSVTVLAVSAVRPPLPR
ncbi:methyltransferase domain-containing protein [Vallicoccus soli]|uniref:methyltransferase domain-containing protein n=1 Tax=Vallicoccus soli TaxID=2339232 RepID=UPI00105A99B4|nr:methyltransferase domain-containing protein [Vallicoccus soli]